MRGRTAILLLLLLPTGAVVGYLAGPFLARADDTVQLAARVWDEDVNGLTERTLDSEAFRETGRTTASLYAEARGIENRITFGAAMFGTWCGLVVLLKLYAGSLIPHRREYEIDHVHCVSCARCFLSCPRERLRLKNLTEPD